MPTSRTPNGWWRGRSRPDGRTIVRAGGLLVGAALLAVVVARTDVRALGGFASQLGALLPIALLPGALWHIIRTEAWRVSFPVRSRPRFTRLFRVRLAAEAFSFVTVRGVAGEPLKIVLLSEVEPALATASVALERIAYLFATAFIVGAAALGALATASLSPGWRGVFIALAVSGLGAAVVPAVLALRRVRPYGSDVPAEPRAETRAIPRLLRAFGIQFRRLVNEDRGRLARLLWLETLAFAAMALEVWAVLWAANTPISFPDAASVEAFTRVTSMLSAFIPGNVGALEVSNVAAAAALHAAAGAAALALVRRLRGLLWCAAGFLVYPRRGPGAHTTRDEGSRVLVVLERSTPVISPCARLGGMPLGERILRVAARAGYRTVLAWTPHHERAWCSLAASVREVKTRTFATRADWHAALERLDPATGITVLGPGVIPSAQLLAAADAIQPGPGDRLLEVPAGPGWPCSGIYRLTRDQLLDPAFRASIERAVETLSHRTPSGRVVAAGEAGLVLHVTTEPERLQAERTLRDSVFKPTDANLARFNRRLSIPLSVALIRWARLSPHTMSVGVAAFGVYAGWLFSRGTYASGIAGALVSLAASILDGCDGELARLQYKESAFGTWLDTIGDYLYYVAVFGGMAVGLTVHRETQVYEWIGVAAILGMVATFALLIVLRRQLTRDHPERLRATMRAHFDANRQWWSRALTSISTCTTRATLPYGILGFALLHRLDWLLAIVAFASHVYWIRLAVELRRLLAVSTEDRQWPVPARAPGA